MKIQQVDINDGTHSNRRYGVAGVMMASSFLRRVPRASVVEEHIITRIDE